MRRLKMILVTCVVASSLIAAAGTSWAATASFERGTSWTDAEGGTLWELPGGASWETLDF
jgi:hypothetical protein